MKKTSSKQIPNIEILARDAGEEGIAEYLRTTKKHPKSESLHEAWAVLHEETCELWDEVRKKNLNKIAVRDEAIQVIAMAIKIIVECCDTD